MKSYLSTALLVLVSLSPCKAHNKKITVVGAGLSGLTTIYRLKQNGYHAVGYEANTRPGGRVYTCYFDNGSYEELGGMSIDDGGYADHILSLIKELELELETYYYKPENMRFFDASDKPDYVHSFIKKGPLPTPELYNTLQQNLTSFSSIGSLFDSLFNPHTPPRIITEKWLCGYEGSPTHALSIGYFDLFWKAYKRMCGIIDEDYSHDEFFTMSTVKNGMCNLIEALCSSIGDCIYYNHVLTKISYNHTTDKTILVFSNGTSIETDYTILTLPCTTLREVEIEQGLFPDDQKTMINTLQYGSNAKLLIPIDPQFYTHPSFDLGNTAANIICSKPVIWCYFGGKEGVFDHFSIKELTNVFKQEKPYLKELFPDRTLPNSIHPVPSSDKAWVRSNEAVGISWINEPFSKGSYTSVAPEQHEAYNNFSIACSHIVRTAFRPIKNRIFFAGEHTSFENYATMEGAVESGERTAKMLLYLFKHENQEAFS
ncbi:MAG: flavin monoamine oxidase family protein [Candidatus Babeliales bacterium]